MVDVAVLAIVAWNVARGVRRGFLESVVNLAVFVLSVSMAASWTALVAGWSAAQFGIPYSISEFVGFVVIWALGSLLLGAAAGFVTGPFDVLLWGSVLDLLLSLVTCAVKGIAVAGFSLMLVLSPPTLLLGFVPNMLADLRAAVEQSNLASKVVEGMSLYERWARPLLTLPASWLRPDLTPPSRLGPPGRGSSAMKDVLPAAGARGPQPHEPPAQALPPQSTPPTTGQGFPREVYEGLDLLDRAGDTWVRDAVNRWVATIRFVPGGDAAGHLPGTGYFGQMTPTHYLNGIYYSEIIFAQGQRQRGRFFAGWLAHEATHVLQSNTDLAAYKNCVVRESQAYLLQGYVLLDLFGQDLDAIRRASGVYPHEIQYAAAAKAGDIDAMVRYVGPGKEGIGECP